MAVENQFHQRNRNRRTRWNVSLLVFFSLLSLIVWEVFLRGILVRLVHRGFSEHTSNDEETLFGLLDTDSNGLLSSYEWLPYFYQCASTHQDRFLSDTKQNVYNRSSLHLQNVEEVITIRAFFKPVLLETLKKDVSFLSEENLGSLTGLMSWKRPHHEWKNFAARDFSVFLPPPKKQVGDTWWVVAPAQPSSGQLSSNRHNPPPVGKHFEFLVNLIDMFHRRPFLVTRFHPQGTLAVLRAENALLLDIIFRAHVEFQLNEPDKYPFWFTPAQLRGRVIVDRSNFTVHYFSLELPASRPVNVDMEWLNGPDEFENMEVDIGFVPLMSLRSSGPSVLVNATETKGIWDLAIDGPADYETHIESFVWDKEIAMEDTYRKLEHGMYPFTQVPYYNLTEALTIAEQQKKPVHAILLWGALDDQSC